MPDPTTNAEELFGPPLSLSGDAAVPSGEAAPAVAAEDAPTPSGEGPPGLTPEGEMSEEGLTLEEVVPAPVDAESLFGPGVSPATAGEEIGAVGQGAATGLIHGGGISLGARAGFQAGGFAGVPGRIVGTILGVAGGYYLGDELVETLADIEGMQITFKSLDDVPAHLQPLAAFGETFGGFVGPTGLVTYLGRSGTRLVIDSQAGRFRAFAGNLLNGMLEQAGTRTGRFIATEASAAATAATAGAVAVSAFPGEPAARLGAELVGGVASPTRFILGLGSDIYQGAKRFVRSMDPALRQTKAGRILQDYIRLAGEDPSQHANVLRGFMQAFPPGARPTLGQIFGDGPTSLFEAELKAINQEFGVTAERAARDTLDALAAATLLYREAGGFSTSAPARATALTEAARLRDAAFKHVIQLRVDRAAQRALRDAGAIRGGLLPENASDLSTIAHARYAEALSEARAVGKELWAKVKDVPVRMSSLTRRYREVRSEMLEVDSLTPRVDKMMALYQESGALLNKLQRAGLTPDNALDLFKLSRGRGVDPARRDEARALIANLGVSADDIKRATKRFSATELQKFRNAALEDARVADKEGRDDLSRRLGLLAESALSDIESGYQRAIKSGVLDKGATEAYATARGYTFQLHETFTRAFGGVTETLGRRGELSVPPEILLRRALASGNELSALRFQELEQASRFLPDLAKEGLELAPDVVERATQNADKLLDVQTQFLRLAAGRVVKDGKLSIESANSFLEEQAVLLARFPAVRSLLENAITSERARHVTEVVAKQRLASAAHTSAFAKLARVESPADAIGKALGGDAPVRELEAMYNLARRAEAPEAVEGFRAAVWDYVAREATVKQNNGLSRLSMPRLIELLDRPLKPGLPSLLILAESQGWMTAREVSAVRQFSQQAVNVLRSVGLSPTGELVFGGGVEDIKGAAADLILRIAGAKVGRAVATLGGGPSAGESLIASYAGSRVMRRVFQRLPRLQLEKIAIGAMRGDPVVPGAAPYSLAIALLEAPQSASRAIQLAMQVHAYAISSIAAYSSADASEENEPTEAEQLFGPR